MTEENQPTEVPDTENDLDFGLKKKKKKSALKTNGADEIEDKDSGRMIVIRSIVKTNHGSGRFEWT